MSPKCYDVFFFVMSLRFDGVVVMTLSDLLFALALYEVSLLLLSFIIIIFFFTKFPLSFRYREGRMHQLALSHIDCPRNYLFENLIGNWVVDRLMDGWIDGWCEVVIRCLGRFRLTVWMNG